MNAGQLNVGITPLQQKFLNLSIPNDESTAVSIAIILLLIVLIFSFEYFYNSKLKFNYSPNSKIDYTLIKKNLFFHICLVFPIVFGFLFIILFYLM